MKKSKKSISLILSVLMILSVFQVGLSAFAADGNVTLKPIDTTIMSRPQVTITATEVTRVAAAVNSQEIGTTIVKATPSGVPELTGSYASQAYAGETPTATTITFDADRDVTDVAISCTAGSDNVVLSGATVSGNTYTWTVVSGNAEAGTMLEFSVTYNYQGNAYTSRCYSYVEGICQPAGLSINTENYTKYMDWTLWHNEYAASNYNAVLLGKGVYGNSALPTNGSIGYYNAATNTFVELQSENYNMYRYSETYVNEKKKTFDVDGSTAQAEIYLDTSVAKNLSDINLRIPIMFNESSRDTVNKSFDLVNVYAKNGAVSASSTSSDDSMAMANLEIVNRTKAGIAYNTQHIVNFTGELTANGTYTAVLHTFGEGNEKGWAENNTKAGIVLNFHVTDKGSLRNTINYVLTSDPETMQVNNVNKGSNPQTWYYKGGYANFKQALETAYKELNNPRATQAEIDGAAESLASAYTNLILKNADYSTRVDPLVEQAEAIFDHESDYTADSVALLYQAYDQVKRGYNILYQNAVDCMADNLQTAIDNMKLLPADYTAVDNAVATANTYVKEYYSNFETVEEAINAVVRGLDITKQEQVNEYAAAIEAALAALIEYDADYSRVNALKAEAEELMKHASDYVTASTGELRKAVRAVKEGYKISRQAEVDAMADAIQAGIDGLQLKPATLTKLNEAVKLIPELDKSRYDADLYAAWESLYNQGLEMLDRTDLTIRDNEQINQLAADITSAYELVIASASTGVNLKPLTDAVNKALDYEASYYTEDTYGAYTQAVADGQAILDRADELTEADNEMVAQAAQRILDAIDALELIGADYTQFDAAVQAYNEKAAETISVVTYEKSGSKYVLGETTAAKYLQSAIDSGANYIAGCDKTLDISAQDTVDGYAAQINAYKDALSDNLNKVDTYLNSAMEMYTADSANADSYTEVSWSAYEAAYNAALAGAEAQADINTLVTNLINAKNALVSTAAYLEPAENTEVVIDREDGFIYGLEEGLTSLDGFVDAVGGELVYTPTANGFGTGTKVEFVVGGEVRETYYIVIFGDVNGDGYIDVFDQADLTSVANMESEYSAGSAYELAADLNGDGFIDVFDLTILTSAANLETVIDQVRP